MSCAPRSTPSSGTPRLLSEEYEVNDPLDEQAITDLHHISGAGHHLLSLVSNILDLSKIEAGHMQPFYEDTHMDALVGETISMLKPILEKNRNTLTQEFKGLLGPAAPIRPWFASSCSTCSPTPPSSHLMDRSR